MPLKYDGRHIVPAPAVGISKEYLKTSDGKKIGTTFHITLEGHLIPHMGSPSSDGTMLADISSQGDGTSEALIENKIQYSLLKKTEAIRNLFSLDGKLLEIASWRLFESSNLDDAPAMSGFARVMSIDFPSNQYQTVLPYTINLEIDELMCQQLREEGLGPTICELVICDTECNRQGSGGNCPGPDNFPSSFDRDAYSYYTFDVLPNDRNISDFGPTCCDLRVYSQSGAESQQPGGNTETLIHSWWDTLPYAKATSPYVRYPEPVYGSNYVRSRMTGIGGGAEGSAAWGNNFRNSSAQNQSVNGHKGLLVGFWFNSNYGAFEPGGGCSNRTDEWDAESMAVEGVVTKSSIGSEWSAGKSGATQNTDHPIESMNGEWGIYSHQLNNSLPGSFPNLCGQWHIGLGFYVNVTDGDKTATLNSQSCSSSVLGYTEGMLAWPDGVTEDDGCYDSKSTGFPTFGPQPEDSSAWGLVFFLIDAENKEAYVIVKFEGETTTHTFKVQDWTGSIIESPTENFNVFYNSGYGNSLNSNGDLRGAFSMNYNQDCGLNSLFTIPIDDFGAGGSRYTDVLNFHSGIFNKRQTFQPYYSLNNHGLDATAWEADLTVTNGVFKTSTTTGYSTVTPVPNVGDYFMSFDDSSNSFCTAPIMEIPATYNDSNGWPIGAPSAGAGGTSLVGNVNTTGYLRVMFWINVANVVGVIGHSSPEMGIITRGGANISGGTGSGQWGLYGMWNYYSSKFEIHAQMQTVDGTHIHLEDWQGVDHLELDPGYWYLCELEFEEFSQSAGGLIGFGMTYQKCGGAKEAWGQKYYTGHLYLKNDDTTPVCIGYNSDAPTASHGYLGSEGGEILLQGIGFSMSVAERATGWESLGAISFDDYYNSCAGRLYYENSSSINPYDHDDITLFCDLLPAEQTGRCLGGPCGVTYVDCMEQADWDGLNSCIGSEDYGSALQNIVAESGQSFMDLFLLPEGSTWEAEYESQNPDRVFLSSADESWSVDDAGAPKGADTYYVHTGPSVVIETDTSPTFSLSHTVSAAGKRAYHSEGLIREPWQNSKLWVDSRLGIPFGDASNPILMPVDVSNVSRMFKMQKARSDYMVGNNVSPNVNRFSLVDDNGDGAIDYSPYNYTRNHTIDKTTGNYSVTENWTLAKTEDGANVIEEITSELSESQESDKTRTIVINGQIGGLETRGVDLQIVQSKYEAAIERYTNLTETMGAGELIYLIALRHASFNQSTGVGLKIPHVSKTVTFNEEEGSITFGYTFDNRYQSITGSISETVSIDIKDAQDRYAIIPIIGKQTGPVIQDLGTRSVYEATVTANIVMGDAERSSGPPTVNEAGALWLKVWPPAGYTPLHDLKNLSKNDSWDPIGGVYTKSKTYQWHYNANC